MRTKKYTKWQQIIIWGYSGTSFQLLDNGASQNKQGVFLCAPPKCNTSFPATGCGCICSNESRVVKGASKLAKRVTCSNKYAKGIFSTALSKAIQIMF